MPDEIWFQNQSCQQEQAKQLVFEMTATQLGKEDHSETKTKGNVISEETAVCGQKE